MTTTTKIIERAKEALSEGKTVLIYTTSQLQEKSLRKLLPQKEVSFARSPKDASISGKKFGLTMDDR
jgi:hypothetical protein